jgi:hypothetical protein
MKFRVVYVYLISLKPESFWLTNSVKEFGGVRVNVLRATVLEPPLTLPCLPVPVRPVFQITATNIPSLHATV